jgi:hypothetical protein
MARTPDELISLLAAWASDDAGSPHAREEMSGKAREAARELYQLGRQIGAAQLVTALTGLIDTHDLEAFVTDAGDLIPGPPPGQRLYSEDCRHPLGQVIQGTCALCGEDVYRGYRSVPGMRAELVRREVTFPPDATRVQLAYLLDETSPAGRAMQEWAARAGPLRGESRSLDDPRFAGRATAPPAGPLQAEATWPNPHTRSGDSS